MQYEGSLTYLKLCHVFKWTMNYLTPTGTKKIGVDILEVSYHRKCKFIFMILEINSSRQQSIGNKFPCSSELKRSYCLSKTFWHFRFSLAHWTRKKQKTPQIIPSLPSWNTNPDSNIIPVPHQALSSSEICPEWNAENVDIIQAFFSSLFACRNFILFEFPWIYYPVFSCSFTNPIYCDPWYLVSVTIYISLSHVMFN